MVFKVTITIEWNGLGQPFYSMVFQWFFRTRQPLVSMVFNSCPPLVRPWNGNIPSLKSSHKSLGLLFNAKNKKVTQPVTSVKALANPVFIIAL